ncbi:hypothetical protein SNEBB_007067 [Seison nebaliae]|nr:hypothetical protein SNEBB_007067 [Seison nebaliae]
MLKYERNNIPIISLTTLSKGHTSKTKLVTKCTIFDHTEHKLKLQIDSEGKWTIKKNLADNLDIELKNFAFTLSYKFPPIILPGLHKWNLHIINEYETYNDPINITWELSTPNFQITTRTPFINSSWKSGIKFNYENNAINVIFNKKKNFQANFISVAVKNKKENFSLNLKVKKDDNCCKFSVNCLKDTWNVGYQSKSFYLELIRKIDRNVKLVLGGNHMGNLWFGIQLTFQYWSGGLTVKNRDLFTEFSFKLLQIN